MGKRKFELIESSDPIESPDPEYPFEMPGFMDTDGKICVQYRPKKRVRKSKRKSSLSFIWVQFSR